VGEETQLLGEKFASTKDRKQAEAHDGMKAVMSLERLKVVALAMSHVEVHSVENSMGLRAILWENIWTLDQHSMSGPASTGVSRSEVGSHRRVFLSNEAAGKAWVGRTALVLSAHRASFATPAGRRRSRHQWKSEPALTYGRRCGIERDAQHLTMV